MAEALLKYETLDSEQIDDLMASKVPRPPKGWEENDDDNVTKKTDSVEVHTLQPKKNGKIGEPAATSN
jgi:cell division protease FtsH